MQEERNNAESRRLRVERHDKWLKSLSEIEPKTTEPIVIQMTPIFGKTARILSDREFEVLQLVSFGYSTQKIAKELSLSSHTITNHRKNMLARSRCGNLAELVRVAIREGLLH
jgi:DNA-binding CsgD family transcriptional regulator